MDDIERKVVDVIERFLARHGRSGAAIAPATSLYQDGLGMDSLDAAEFSTLLERAFGRDPYSSGDFPRTVADVVGFYRLGAGGAS
jgi:acyl carrier protein